jgi:hypothetical protein
MSASTIPTRLNGQNIENSWFNILKTVIEEGSGQWTKYTVTYSDLSAAALTNDIELFSLLAKEIPEVMIIKHSVSFQDSGGGSISAFSVSLGVTGDLTKMASAFDVYQAAGATVFQVSEYATPENFSSATSIRIAATSVGANLDQADQGSLDVWVKTSLLP